MMFQFVPWYPICAFWCPIFAFVVPFSLLMFQLALLMSHFCFLVSHYDECIGWCLLRWRLFVLDASCPRLLRQLHRAGQCLCIIIRVIQIYIIMALHSCIGMIIFHVHYNELAVQLMLCKLSLRHIWISQTAGSWDLDSPAAPYRLSKLAEGPSGHNLILKTKQTYIKEILS